MSAQDVVFVLIAIATGGAALTTVTSKNLVHAALFLAVTLTGIGGVFFVLAADFVALVQLVVYVGAIAVLFLFGLMLTRAPIGREALDSQNRAMGIGISVVLFGVLVTLILQSGSEFAAEASTVGGGGVADIGLAIFSAWVFPFEVASMLLLGALIGAIVLSRRETGESGEETPITAIDVGDPGFEDQPELTTTGRQP
ncbi:MAG: NADH-quinone oxidoreductase subunit J [Acidimicrobiales bacterium]|nr:NADH-quinone oxidoreductase subunit J [Acidimicrobiales bacterium]